MNLLRTSYFNSLYTSEDNSRLIASFIHRHLSHAPREKEQSHICIFHSALPDDRDPITYGEMKAPIRFYHPSLPDSPSQLLLSSSSPPPSPDSYPNEREQGFPTPHSRGCTAGDVCHVTVTCLVGNFHKSLVGQLRKSKEGE